MGGAGNGRRWEWAAVGLGGGGTGRRRLVWAAAVGDGCNRDLRRSHSGQSHAPQGFVGATQVAMQRIGCAAGFCRSDASRDFGGGNGRRRLGTAVIATCVAPTVANRTRRKVL